MEYIANFSGGKDSTAMVLKLMRGGYPLTKVIMFDTGAEYQCIYNNAEKMKKLCEENGIEFVTIKTPRDFFYDMLLKPIQARGGKPRKYGRDWCGGLARWKTAHKRDYIDTYLRKIGDYVQYVGIAADEPNRAKDEKNKKYPLVEWGMTEADCLQYCYDNGWDWKEGDVELYSILDRCSCWCCGNKNLKELKNMYLYLPEYWDRLKALQSRIPTPYRRDGKTVFDLEERFKKELEKEAAERAEMGAKLRGDK